MQKVLKMKILFTYFYNTCVDFYVCFELEQFFLTRKNKYPHVYSFKMIIILCSLIFKIFPYEQFFI